MSVYGTDTYGVGIYGSVGPDTTPPTVPSGLTAVAFNANRINLSWTASTDNVAVTGYTVYRGGSPLATIAGTSYSDTGVFPLTTYTYSVDAYDAAGNHSAQSSSASATTPATVSQAPGVVPSMLGALLRLGPRTSSAGTTYSAGQIWWMLFSPSLQLNWCFDLLNAEGYYKADLTPLVDFARPPTLDHDSSRAVKRQLANLNLRASNSVDVNRDLVRVRFQVLAPDGGWLEWPLGIFMFTPPTKSIAEGITWWTLNAPDLSQQLALAALPGTSSSSAGTPYVQAIAQLLSVYGGPTRLTADLIDTGLALGADLPWDAGASYLSVINKLLEGAVYVPAAMRNFQLVSRPIPDYGQQPVAMMLDTVAGQGQVLGPFSETQDRTNAYNQIGTTAGDPRLGEVTGYYENTRPESPVSTVRSPPRFKLIQDSKLSTRTAAQLRAIAEIQAGARIYSTLTVGLPPFPFFEDLDVVRLVYNSVDEGLVDERYLVQRWQCPLGMVPTVADFQRVVAV